MGVMSLCPSESGLRIKDLAKNVQVESMLPTTKVVLNTAQGSSVGFQHIDLKRQQDKHADSHEEEDSRIDGRSIEFGMKGQTGLSVERSLFSGDPYLFMESNLLTQQYRNFVQANGPDSTSGSLSTSSLSTSLLDSSQSDSLSGARLVNNLIQSSILPDIPSATTPTASKLNSANETAIGGDYATLSIRNQSVDGDFPKRYNRQKMRGKTGGVHSSLPEADITNSGCHVTAITNHKMRDSSMRSVPSKLSIDESTFKVISSNLLSGKEFESVDNKESVSSEKMNEVERRRDYTMNNATFNDLGNLVRAILYGWSDTHEQNTNEKKVITELLLQFLSLNLKYSPGNISDIQGSLTQVTKSTNATDVLSSSNTPGVGSSNLNTSAITSSELLSQSENSAIELLIRGKLEELGIMLSEGESTTKDGNFIGKVTQLQNFMAAFKSQIDNSGCLKHPYQNKDLLQVILSHLQTGQTRLDQITSPSRLFATSSGSISTPNLLANNSTAYTNSKANLSVCTESSREKRHPLTAKRQLLSEIGFEKISNNSFDQVIAEDNEMAENKSNLNNSPKPSSVIDIDSKNNTHIVKKGSGLLADAANTLSLSYENSSNIGFIKSYKLLKRHSVISETEQPQVNKCSVTKQTTTDRFSSSNNTNASNNRTADTDLLTAAKPAKDRNSNKDRENACSVRTSVASDTTFLSASNYSTNPVNAFVPTYVSTTANGGSSNSFANNVTTSSQSNSCNMSAATSSQIVKQKLKNCVLNKRRSRDNADANSSLIVYATLTPATSTVGITSSASLSCGVTNTTPASHTTDSAQFPKSLASAVGNFNIVGLQNSISGSTATLLHTNSTSSGASRHGKRLARSTSSSLMSIELTAVPKQNTPALLSTQVSSSAINNNSKYCATKSYDKSKSSVDSMKTTNSTAGTLILDNDCIMELDNEDTRQTTSTHRSREAVSQRNKRKSGKLGHSNGVSATGSSEDTSSNILVARKVNTMSLDAFTQDSLFNQRSSVRQLERNSTASGDIGDVLNKQQAGVALTYELKQNHSSVFAHVSPVCETEQRLAENPCINNVNERSAPMNCFSQITQSDVTITPSNANDVYNLRTNTSFEDRPDLRENEHAKYSSSLLINSPDIAQLDNEESKNSTNQSIQAELTHQDSQPEVTDWSQLKSHILCHDSSVPNEYQLPAFGFANNGNNNYNSRIHTALLPSGFYFRYAPYPVGGHLHESVGTGGNIYNNLRKTMSEPSLKMRGTSGCNLAQKHKLRPDSNPYHHHQHFYNAFHPHHQHHPHQHGRSISSRYINNTQSILAKVVAASAEARASGVLLDDGYLKTLQQIQMQNAQSHQQQILLPQHYYTQQELSSIEAQDVLSSHFVTANHQQTQEQQRQHSASLDLPGFGGHRLCVDNGGFLLPEIGKRDEVNVDQSATHYCPETVMELSPQIDKFAEGNAEGEELGNSLFANSKHNAEVVKINANHQMVKSGEENSDNKMELVEEEVLSSSRHSSPTEIESLSKQARISTHLTSVLRQSVKPTKDCIDSCSEQNLMEITEDNNLVKHQRDQHTSIKNLGIISDCDSCFLNKGLAANSSASEGQTPSFFGAQNILSTTQTGISSLLPAGSNGDYNLSLQEEREFGNFLDGIGTGAYRIGGQFNVNASSMPNLIHQSGLIGIQANGLVHHLSQPHQPSSLLQLSDKNNGYQLVLDKFPHYSQRVLQNSFQNVVLPHSAAIPVSVTEGCNAVGPNILSLDSQPNTLMSNVDYWPTICSSSFACLGNVPSVGSNIHCPAADPSNVGVAIVPDAPMTSAASSNSMSSALVDQFNQLPRHRKLLLGGLLSRFM